MSVNPIDPTNTDKPTGSLEELFRHHMAEAAVPPRPMLWEQIDNSLLIEQNQIYRRRLNAMRWVAAASLLLATLTGTGWLAMRDAVNQGSRLARTEGPAQTRAVANAAIQDKSQWTNQATFDSRGRLTARGATAATASLSKAVRPAAADVTGRLDAAAASYAAASGTGNNLGPQAGETTRTLAITRPAAANARVSARTTLAAGTGTYRARLGRTDRTSLQAGGPQAAIAMSEPTMEAGATPAGSIPAAAERTIGLGQGIATSVSGRPFGSTGSATAGLPVSSPGPGFGTESQPIASSILPTPKELDLLAGRAAVLAGTGSLALPTSFATLEVPADGTPPVVPPVRKWQFAASYAVGAFQPNTNFSRAGVDAEFDYNPALGANSPALSEAAAAEHLSNLRPGSSHRLAVRATRRLTGRWALSTGAELSQNFAKSASTMAFVGEQVPDFGPNTRGEMRSTDFRYRTAGVPVEVHYANPVKRGWSAYGRVGAVVSALLGVRSEVAGIPEATRSYSLTSAGTPYRRVLTNVRGAAGAQFRPTEGSWTFTLGPVAEMGLLSLNAHPGQSFLGQSRSYNVGLEAGVEFGRSQK